MLRRFPQLRSSSFCSFQVIARSSPWIQLTSPTGRLEFSSLIVFRLFKRKQHWIDSTFIDKVCKLKLSLTRSIHSSRDRLESLASSFNALFLHGLTPNAKKGLQQNTKTKTFCSICFKATSNPIKKINQLSFSFFSKPEYPLI